MSSNCRRQRLGEGAGVELAAGEPEADAPALAGAAGLAPGAAVGATVAGGASATVT